MYSYGISGNKNIAFGHSILKILLEITREG